MFGVPDVAVCFVDDVRPVTAVEGDLWILPTRRLQPEGRLGRVRPLVGRLVEDEAVSLVGQVQPVDRREDQRSARRPVYPPRLQEAAAPRQGDDEIPLFQPGQRQHVVSDRRRRQLLVAHQEAFVARAGRLDAQ